MTNTKKAIKPKFGKRLSEAARRKQDAIAHGRRVKAMLRELDFRARYEVAGQ